MSDAPKVGNDRVGLLERYHEAVGLPPIDKSDTAPAAAEASSDNANNSPDSAAHPEGEHTDTAPTKPVAKEVVTPDPSVKKVEKTEEPKTVPVAALHEEREKRKAKTLEARQLQEKLSVRDQELADLKVRLASVEDVIRKAKAGEPVDAEPDEVTKQLAEENKTLKENQAKAEQANRIKTQEDAAKETARLISECDSKLTTEGFPGFQKFGKDVYQAIVAKIKSGELEEKDVTTDLWAKVYKEEVYPAMKELFDAKLRQERLDAKNKQKKAANLVTNPGEGPAPKEEDNLDAPQSAESYMKMRKRIF